MNFTKQIVLLFSSVTLVFFMSACGSGGSGTVVDAPTESTRTIAGSSEFIINPATTYDEMSAINGVMFKATTVDSNTSTDIVDAVAGLAIESTRTSAGSTTDELHAIIRLIAAGTYTDGNISTINEQVFSKYTAFTVGDYSFVTDTNVTTVSLANEIANTLSTTSAASLDENLTDGVTASEFRMFVTVTNFNSKYYYTVSISPKPDAIFHENFALMTAISSGTNYYSGNAEHLVGKRNNYKGVAGASNRADFLFVIDDSGSMGDQQDALNVAADDFDVALALADMNYTIAILTTGEGAQDNSANCAANDCYDRVVTNIGIIDNNITLFKEQVDDINTSGSATETGIYNSEVALSSGGILDPLGFPRNSTQLSVIILSDEPSQYSSRGGSFDPSSNLFVSNNILVNSIVDIGLCTNPATGAADPNGQYDDLAIATGGLVGNICNGGDTPNFSAVMQNIVFQAAGVYKLGHNYVKPNSIKVSVDGNFSSPSIKQGYMFIEGTNSIAFFGNLPAENAAIEVYYEYPKDIHLFE